MKYWDTELKNSDDLTLDELREDWIINYERKKTIILGCIFMGILLGALISSAIWASWFSVVCNEKPIAICFDALSKIK